MSRGSKHFLLICLVGGWLGAAQADQFIWNSRGVCSNAVQHLPTGAVVLSYCSECDGEKVEVWKVSRAAISPTTYEHQFEVLITGTRLFRSKKAFEKGHYQEPVAFEKVEDSESTVETEPVDLAYFYFQKPDGTFKVMARELNLQPLDCAVETIKLPKSVLEKLPK